MINGNLRRKQMTTYKGKNIVVDLSASSSFDDKCDEDDNSASFSSDDECGSIDDDEDYQVDDDEAEDIGEDDDCHGVKNDDCHGVKNDDCHGVKNDDCHGVKNEDDNTLANRVICFLEGGRDLKELNVQACKAYLRRHGLRMSGKKNECILRIQEHWRLKDGKADILYPVTSFVIDCTGDVCKGDIVLFRQRVYARAGKGKVIGRRTVVGRVVKESYGTRKQQHTFTVEVLWTKGLKKLPALFPLLIKGRNLYRMRTYRQLWKSEEERTEVLGEKHRRGNVARLNRAKRINVLSSDKGESQKVSHCRRSSQMSFPGGGKCYDTEKGASPISKNCNHEQRNVKQGAAQINTRSQFSKPSLRHQNLEFRDDRTSTLPSYHAASQKYIDPEVRWHHRSTPFSSQFTKFRPDIPYHRPILIPAAPPYVFNQSRFGNPNVIQPPWETCMDHRQFLPSRIVHGQWMHGPFKCSFQGCFELGTNGCVIAACWRCCQSRRIGCIVHG